MEHPGSTLSIDRQLSNEALVASTPVFQSVAVLLLVSCAVPSFMILKVCHHSMQAYGTLFTSRLDVLLYRLCIHDWVHAFNDPALPHIVNVTLQPSLPFFPFTALGLAFFLSHFLRKKASGFTSSLCTYTWPLFGLCSLTRLLLPCRWPAGTRFRQSGPE